MSGERFMFRRGSVATDIPAAEHLGVGEPIYDNDKGSLGIGAGEQNPRWYPGVNGDGNLVLQEGQQICSPDNPDTKIGFINGFFVVTVEGKQVLKVSKDGNTIIDNLKLSDKLLFENIQTDNFPDTPGFAYQDGKFIISCPLEVLGSINLSASDLANGVIPRDYRPGDILAAPEVPNGPVRWTDPTSLVTKVTTLAPLLYRAATKNTRSIDMSFGPIPMYFGMNTENKGVLNDNLNAFLSAFASGFSRSSIGYRFNSLGKLAPVANNVPRLDYDPATGRFLGILIEDASQNILVNSNNFETYTGQNMNAVQFMRQRWTDLGLRNPSSLSEIGSGEHYIEKSFNNRPLNLPFAYSFCVEIPAENSNTRLQLTLEANSHKYGVKLLLNNTSATVTENINVGNGSLLSTHITKLGDGFYRVGVSGVFDANNTSLFTAKARIQGLNPANLTTYTSSASGIAFIGEAQAEPNRRVTSLMPTNSTVFVREADNLFLNLGFFNFTVFKNILGIKFLSKNYTVGDPIFTVYSDGFRGTLEAESPTKIQLVKGIVDNETTTSVATIDNDFVNYEYDCAGHAINSVLNVGANKDFSKHFNGWVNLIYLYR